MHNLLGTNPLVMYRINTQDLQDYFELASDEEAHVALEGVLNIIFGREDKSLMDEILGYQVAEDPYSEITDHEVQVATEAINMMLHMHDQAQAKFGMPPIEYDDISMHPRYKAYEYMFNQILIKLSDDVSNDKYNQDIVTLTNEMTFHNRIELYSYRYNIKTGVLHITIRVV